MRVYTVYLKYDDVEDFNAFNANSEEEAIANAQKFYNTNPDFADTVVTVYKAIAY